MSFGVGWPAAVGLMFSHAAELSPTWHIPSGGGRVVIGLWYMGKLAG